MEDETKPPFDTTVVKKDRENIHGQNSQVYAISVRAWLAILITITICGLAVLGIKVEEPLYTLSVMVLSFYFGKSTATNKETTVNKQ